MTIDWAVVSPIIVGLITGIAGYLAIQVQHKGRPENALIDQLQEEVASLRSGRDAELAVMKKDITDLKDEQNKSKRRERIRDDYINKLRHHIEEGKPPPAPEWPAGLYE